MPLELCPARSRPAPARVDLDRRVYHLELGDHCVDQFVYWADAIDDADATSAGYSARARSSASRVSFFEQRTPSIESASRRLLFGCLVFCCGSSRLRGMRFAL